MAAFARGVLDAALQPLTPTSRRTSRPMPVTKNCLRHRSSRALSIRARRRQFFKALLSTSALGDHSRNRNTRSNVTRNPLSAVTSYSTSTSTSSASSFPRGPSHGDGDTIVALATSPAPSAVAVVRVSGPRALSLVASVFRPSSGSKENKKWTAASHTVAHGAIVASNSQVVDEVLVIAMRGPRSYTREDVVEVHTHGGPTCAPRVLEALLDAGINNSSPDENLDSDPGSVRLARPGEFTLRAFLSGRLSLDQAEAVADVVTARSPAAADAALAGLGVASRFSSSSSSSGSASSAAPPSGPGAVAAAARAAALSLLARVEAALDYGEDNDLGMSPSSSEAVVDAALVEELSGIRAAVDSALSNRALGNAMRRGVSVALVGAPNVGKSSLLNALCGHERAIVSDVPGTTRDVVDAPGLLPGGVPVTLLDTAGVRDAVAQVAASLPGGSDEDDDPSAAEKSARDAAAIESLGVARAAEAAAGADVVALVFDASRGWGCRDEEALAGVRRALEQKAKREGSGGGAGKTPPAVLVANKRDAIVVDGAATTSPTPPVSLAENGPPFASVVSVSALTGQGIDDLGAALAGAVGLPTVAPGGNFALINARQAEALSRASEALARAESDASAGFPSDFWSMGLREAVSALGEVGGAGVREEVLDAVFSQFCIGK